MAKKKNIEDKLSIAERLYIDEMIGKKDEEAIAKSLGLAHDLVVEYIKSKPRDKFAKGKNTVSMTEAQSMADDELPKTQNDKLFTEGKLKNATYKFRPDEPSM